AGHLRRNPGGRGGIAAAVVEIDHRAVEIERALDLAPVRLVFGHRRGGASAGNRFSAAQLAECARAHYRKRHSGTEHGGDEAASCCHGAKVWAGFGGRKAVSWRDARWRSLQGARFARVLTLRAKPS